MTPRGSRRVCCSRSRSASSRSPASELVRPQFPLDAGAAVRGLGRLVGSRAPALAGARAAARHRRRAVRIRARAAPARSPAARCSGSAPPSRSSSRGFMGPLWLVATAVVLPLAFASWRTRRYATTVAIALAVALPLGAAWPIALAASSPADLAAWWSAQSWTDWFGPLSPQGGGRSRRPAQEPAVVRVARAAARRMDALDARARLQRRTRDARRSSCRARSRSSMLVAIAVMADPRVTYLMPLLLPLALLGALEIDTLKRGFSGALDWFGILTFGLAAALAWGLWFDAYVRGMSTAGRAPPARHRSRLPAAVRSGSRSSSRRCSRCCGSCSCARRAARIGAPC